MLKNRNADQLKSLIKTALAANGVRTILGPNGKIQYVDQIDAMDIKWLATMGHVEHVVWDFILIPN